VADVYAPLTICYANFLSLLEQARKIVATLRGVKSTGEVPGQIVKIGEENRSRVDIQFGGTVVRLQA
jgi:hypothetical protein